MTEHDILVFFFFPQRFIKPDQPERNLGISFIVYAGVGLGLNVTGAIVFFITGKGHSHAGHGESFLIFLFFFF